MEQFGKFPNVFPLEAFKMYFNNYHFNLIALKIIEP